MHSVLPSFESKTSGNVNKVVSISPPKHRFASTKPAPQSTNQFLHTVKVEGNAAFWAATKADPSGEMNARVAQERIESYN